MDNDAKDSWERALIAALNGVPDNTFPMTSASARSNFKTSVCGSSSTFEQPQTSTPYKYRSPPPLLSTAPTARSAEPPEAETSVTLETSGSNYRIAFFDVPTDSSSDSDIDLSPNFGKYPEKEESRVGAEQELQSTGGCTPGSNQDQSKEGGRKGSLVKVPDRSIRKEGASAVPAGSGSGGDRGDDPCRSSTEKGHRNCGAARARRASAVKEDDTCTHEVECQHGRDEKRPKCNVKPSNRKGKGKRRRRHENQRTSERRSRKERKSMTAAGGVDDGTHSSSSSDSFCGSELSFKSVGSDGCIARGSVTKRMKRHLSSGEESTRRVWSLAAGKNCPRHNSTPSVSKVWKRMESSSSSEGGNKDRREAHAPTFRRRLQRPKECPPQQQKTTMRDDPPSPKTNGGGGSGGGGGGGGGGNCGDSSAEWPNARWRVCDERKPKRVFDQSGQIKFDSSSDEQADHDANKKDNDVDEKTIIGGLTNGNMNNGTLNVKARGNIDARDSGGGSRKNRNITSKHAPKGEDDNRKEEQDGEEDDSEGDDLDETQWLKPMIAEPTFLDPDVLPLRLENRDGSQTAEVPAATNRYLHGFQKDGVSNSLSWW